MPAAPPSAWSLLDDPAEWPGFGRALDGDAAGRWESQAVVEGMHCAACAFTVEAALRQVPGVLSAEVNAASRRARVVWSAVCQLDLGSWLGEIKAVEGHVGRDATPPQLLVALWVYATLRGIASARELERLCHNHLAYRWLCGGVSVNHHLLSDFRSTGGDKWDALLTQLV